MAITPFRYPKSKHFRTERPKQYSTYGSFKPTLRKEFRRQCVYCRIPDGFNDPFSVDHYKPKKKFPALATRYTNLFYACSRCNSSKGDYWPSTLEMDKGVFIPNPCDHFMASHLWFREQVVDPKDVAGKFTVNALCLNDDEKVLFREFVERAITNGLLQARKHRQTLTQIATELKTAPPERSKELIDGRSQIEAALDTVLLDLVRLTGDESFRVPK